MTAPPAIRSTDAVKASVTKGELNVWRAIANAGCPIVLGYPPRVIAEISVDH